MLRPNDWKIVDEHEYINKRLDKLDASSHNQMKINDYQQIDMKELKEAFLKLKNTYEDDIEMFRVFIALLFASSLAAWIKILFY